jgi:hypothetical protein
MAYGPPPNGASDRPGLKLRPAEESHDDRGWEKHDSNSRMMGGGYENGHPQGEAVVVAHDQDPDSALLCRLCGDRYG